MLGKLITTIICLILLAFFAGFNLDNKCDVNLLFHTFKNVPVFFTIIVSFVVGIIFTIPFAFFHRKQNKTSENPVRPVNSNVPLKTSQKTNENEKPLKKKKGFKFGIAKSKKNEDVQKIDKNGSSVLKDLNSESEKNPENHDEKEISKDNDAEKPKEEKGKSE